MNEVVTRRLPMVGRQEEKSSITRAIRGQGSSIIFLEGIAGIGKTVLLEAAGRIAQEYGILCPPLVDFYDTEMHAHRILEGAIASILDPGQEVFREYWAQREWMERALRPERKTLREQQEKLWKLFRKGYTRVVEKQRVVLRFDTAERLEYEQDSEEVLKDCGVSHQDAPSWEWLLERIGDLENTSILIASRPTPTRLLKQSLQKAHGERVLVLEIKELTLEETKAYLRATDFGRQVADEAPEMVGKVHLLTEGRPILIALALDWLKRGMWERHIYPASLEDLKTWKTKAQEEEQAGQRGEAWRKWDEIKRSFEMALVGQIRSLDHKGLDMAVKYVALARKGCNAELLSRLMGVSLEEAEKLVEQLLTLSFVKPPRGRWPFFFLHDEMYDLVEKHIWLVDWPHYEEQARLDGVIKDWYTEQIEALKKRIKACQDWRERTDLRRRQQLLIAERLYYQFDENPRIGYWEYSHWDEEAIGARENEWDIWLRNEALWFTSHRAWRRGKWTDEPGYPLRDPAWIENGEVKRSSAVDHDCRRRWVNRHIARNEMEAAACIAEKLLQKSRESPHPEEPELYQGGVQVALATAQAYMGGAFTEPALTNFDEGIQALMNVPEEHKEPWLFPYLMGTAHLYKGLALRGSFRLNKAAQAYGRAAYYYREIGYQSGLAEAMNNLAYVYAQQGRLETALASCEEALSIRQELGDEYNVGLSLNTKGIIYERMDRPLTAIHNSGQSLALFRQISNERGIILAEINLARSYRRKARSPEWGQKDEDFEAGEEYLEDAIYRQEQLGASADMFYQIEARNELGCLYRNWVATLAEKGMKDDSRIPEYMERAETHLNKSISLAAGEGQVIKRHAVQCVDSLEDLARVYYWRHKLGLSVGSWAAQRGIEKPLRAMKSLLDESKKLAEEHLKEREELRLAVGKTHHEYAQLARAEAEDEKNRDKFDFAAKHYARAAASLESYSLDVPELRQTVSDACDWLCTLHPQEAEQRIKQMYSALEADGQESRKLKEWVNSVVYPRLGLRWPEEEQEAANG